MEELLKVKIKKRGVNIELVTSKPDKHMKNILKLCSDRDVIQRRPIKRPAPENIEDDEQEMEFFGLRFGGTMRAHKEARKMCNKLEKKSNMERTYKIITGVTKIIDVKKKKETVILNKREFINKTENVFKGSGKKKIEGIVIHMTGKGLFDEDYTLIKEKISKQFDNVNAHFFHTPEDLDDKVRIEVAVYGDFTKTYSDYLWED